MYDNVAKLSILVMVGVFAASIIEGAVWLYGMTGLNPHVMSVALRTIGVMCAYIVLRDTAKRIAAEGWRGFFGLIW